MNEHLRYIRNPSQYDEATGRYFNTPGHSIEDFHCRVINVFGGTPKRYDKGKIAKEKFLIDQLNTWNPQGLNDHTGRHKIRS